MSKKYKIGDRIKIIDGYFKGLIGERGTVIPIVNSWDKEYDKIQVKLDNNFIMNLEPKNIEYLSELRIKVRDITGDR